MSRTFRLGILLSILIFSLIVGFEPAAAAPPGNPVPPSGGNSDHQAGRYVLRAKSHADLVDLKQQLVAANVDIDAGLDSVNAVSVDLTAAQAATFDTNTHVSASFKSGIRTLDPPDAENLDHTTTLARHRVNVDPASSLDGLMWNLNRVRAPEANKINAGSPDVIVGVADTGLDFTHSELKDKILGQTDFTALDDPALCKTYYGSSDADMAATYGGPPNTDWNGHGSWIGGNISANLDSVGIQGIAPNIKLYDLKISQWCGSAYDSDILNAFIYAADHKIDIVSISFGGYLDRSDPDQNAAYRLYVDVVNYARTKGTIIVAAAGNEHLRIGTGGRVISHGPLSTPGDPFSDYYGLWETPGGIPGVVMVSATNNITSATSATCATDSLRDGTCKPASDAHQPFGANRTDQLTYYSNYGPRIDIAAPGGARKFNLPNADRGGTPGFPFTVEDGTTAFEDFSITSNWALEIPCATFPAGNGVFYPDECYSTIQGTSMATPHVSAVIALVASARPTLRHQPAMLLRIVTSSAKGARNLTPGLSARDTTPADATGTPCPSGYCHLGGPRISDNDAYGAGVVDALAAVRRQP